VEEKKEKRATARMSVVGCSEGNVDENEEPQQGVWERGGKGGDSWQKQERIDCLIIIRLRKPGSAPGRLFAPNLPFVSTSPSNPPFFHPNPTQCFPISGRYGTNSLLSQERDQNRPQEAHPNPTHAGVSRQSLFKFLQLILSPRPPMHPYARWYDPSILHRYHPWALLQ